MAKRKNKKADERLKEIFAFIKEFLTEKGYPPAVREIGNAVGLRSSSTVHAYLNMMEAQGMIRRNPDTPRGIDILDEKPLGQYGGRAPFRHRGRRRAHVCRGEYGGGLHHARRFNRHQ